MKHDRDDASLSAVTREATTAIAPNSVGRDDRLALIHEIGRAVAGTLDLRTLFDTIWHQVSRVMDTSVFFIALRDNEADTVHVPYLREAGKRFEDHAVSAQGTVTGKVIDGGSAVLFSTLAEYEVYCEEHELGEVAIGEHDPEAMIFVPLTTNDRTIGALSVQSFRPNAYAHEDMQTLAVISSQAAVAIENARLYERSQDNVRHMQALLQVARALNSSLDLKTVLDSLLAGIQNVVPYYLAAILLPDYQHQCLDVVGAAGPLADERRESIKVPFGQGVTGRAFLSGEPHNIGDVSAFEGYIEHGLLLVRSELAVPLKHGDTVVGVLDVERTEAHSFTRADVDALALFASQAAIAIENARLYTDQQQRVFELQTIQNIVQAITPLHDPLTISGAIGTQLRELIAYHAYRMFLFDDQEQVLVPLSPREHETSGLRLSLGQGIAGWVAQHGSPLLVPDAAADPRAAHIPGTPLRSESILAVPLAYEGKVRGVITLSGLGRNQFDENELRLLQIVGAQAAIALDRARLYGELRTEAITDSVTRLHNRRYLMERFREERSRAQRHGHALTAVMLDIDRFKRVNDTYGHDAGDVVLRELASLVRGLLRQEDLVARYGGEEFCILLPELSIDAVMQVAERLSTTIESHPLPTEAGVRSITVSIGVAALAPDDQGHEIFSRADLAMYRAKHRGGNMVCAVSGDEETFSFARDAGTQSE